MSYPEIPLFKVFMADTAIDQVSRVLYSGYVGEGDEVISFEQDLCAALGVRHLLTTNSGTSALHLAYHMAVDGRDNAEIITSPITCTATNTPIVNNNAKIVWADVDPVTGNIDPDDVRALIGPRTCAVVMIHWGGNPGKIDAINEIGREHGIKTIEDAAHGLGATYRGIPVGGHSDFVAFSFQAIKHVTSVDGGGLVCKDDADHARGKLLRWYGIDRTIREGIDLRCEVDVAEAGYKFHMNNVSAAIGRENLKHLSRILESHRQNAEFYNLAFRGHGKIRTVPTNSDAASAYWLYTIHVDNRDELMKRLLENGIGASKVHSRNDTHTMFERFKRPLPNADAFERTHICIPVGWWLSESDRERVADAVMKFAR